MDKQEQQEQQKIPNCIGIILDGNRRWAKKRGLSTLKGHEEGYKKFKEIISWAKEVRVMHLIFYAFSTENWKRDEKEKSYLFELIKMACINDLEEIKKKGVRIRFAGQIDRFDFDIQTALRDAEKQTRESTRITVVLALSYGGRAEILQAVNALLAGGVKGLVTGEEFKKYLWTHDIPDPDLIIRTGGVMRLSNFLPWQSVYSELFFTDTLWPDFSKEEFGSILKEYAARERRYGK